jgi:bacterioferritin-associated ferredoxin
MIVCSCNERTDRELRDEAKKGTRWRDAVLNLPVSNVCGRCKHLCQPMYAEARRQAGYPDESHKDHRSHDKNHDV